MPHSALMPDNTIDESDGNFKNLGLPAPGLLLG
jgi:hypothetical protein